jgi:hypothetical protein
MDKRFVKMFIVYIILIPVTWILSVVVAGGVYGYIGGQRIAKVYSERQPGDELSEFMKKHYFSQSMTKDEAILQFKKLSPQDKAEYKRILFSKIKIDDIESFGSIFIICLIVCGLIGALSGILTRMWLPAGIFPLIILSLDPIRHYIIYGYMSLGQKIITVLFAQFVSCYIFAYLGSLLAKKFSRKKRTT